MLTEPPRPLKNAPGAAGSGGVAVRFLAGALLCIILLASHVPDVELIVIAAITALAFDGRNLLCLKNFFISYAVLVFCVGAGTLHLATPAVFTDVIWYVVAFVAGYTLSSVRPLPDRVVAKHFGHWTRQNPGSLRISSIEAALIVVVATNVLFLLAELTKYGAVSYYRGGALLDQFQTYGKPSAGGGLEQIARFTLQYLSVGLIVVYVQACLEPGVRVRFRYPLTLLVFLPIVALRRSDAVIGAITVLAIYACEKRLSASTGRRPSPARPPRRGSLRPPRDFRRTALVGMAVVSSFTMALVIGSLRQGFGAQQGALPASTGTLSLLTSELSPVRAYEDITTNIAVLGHPNGETIIWPLLLKLVPRAWYPAKPLNSGAYYMSVLRPAEFSGGFALPPTLFGDLYLNFGFEGALAGCFLMGVASGRFDVGYRRSLRSKVPLYLLVFANFYSLLRNALSESLSGILLTLAVWALANRLLRSRDPAPEPKAQTCPFPTGDSGV